MHNKSNRNTVIESDNDVDRKRNMGKIYLYKIDNIL